MRTVHALRSARPVEMDIDKSRRDIFPSGIKDSFRFSGIGTLVYRRYRMAFPFHITGKNTCWGHYLTVDYRFLHSAFSLFFHLLIL